MNKSSHHALDLDQLRAAYPGYDIERDPRRDPVRYSAVARDLTGDPHAIVTADLDELGRERAASRERAATGSMPVFNAASPENPAGCPEDQNRPRQRNN